MIRSCLLLIIINVFVFSTKGQSFNPPNYLKIEEESLDPLSEYNFLYLYSKFQKGDKTFTLKEKRYLYYGLLYQCNYKPYIEPEYEDSLRLSFKNKQGTESDFLEIITFANEILKVKPFDIKVMHNLSYAYYNLGMLDQVNVLIVQMSILYDAIYSTGNGHSKDNAIHVVYLDHENEVISTFGYYQNGMLNFEDNIYDIIGLEDNKDNRKQIYFNIEQMLGCGVK